MGDVVRPGDMRLSMVNDKAAQLSQKGSGGPEEARQAAPAELEPAGNAAVAHPETKENKWKLAFRQLMFMKRMNMQFNDRTKNEIELRQQNISPTSLICSVPYFNSFSAGEIKALVTASCRVSLRPGEMVSLSLANPSVQQEGDFCIVISGHLALAKTSVPSAMAIQQAEFYPQLRLGIGDYFSVQAASDMKVIAMELAEYLTIPMKSILKINAASCALIDAEKNDLMPEPSEMESFKKWALQFSLVRQRSEFPTAETGGFAHCSVKTFCKEHFPNITPENELDHTLEYMRNALTSIFSARKVRIYALDETDRQLVIKFSDEKLSRRSVDITSSAGLRVLDSGGPVCIVDALELIREEIGENDVAPTYVLGIGDRHNDNIMLQRSGKFFHIDFGHFLGNFKTKLGVKRERAPFVFTPSMLDTMGGKKSENYKHFQQLACDAFQVLRTNSNLLITLLVLALTCGIPELHSASCIKWVHKTLMLDLPDDEACEAFKKLIHVALHTTTTKLNDAVHLMAH
ncbi:Phosphatidyl inositol kinase (PIK-B) [Phytophthora cinnamomi]|uniref:Phosphatidyl inositol kinase (PIK-B) n=1 Tax=Phytophthora cinnamomi TaxID=4785 RepID=UPI003559AE24|nr:Phosphatidyl inositol kinase (PIK-B) [Phytophthora cinnamomi]